MIAGAAAAWYFLVYKKTNTGRIEELIPATSIGVLAVDNAKTFYEKLEGYNWWDELSEIPVLAAGKQLISRLDTLSIQSDVTNLPVYVSFHITANNQIDPLYFIESKNFAWNPDALRTILERAYGVGKVSIAERTYQDQIIREVALPDAQFSFFIKGNFLAISPTALLIEDVIRAEGQGLALMAGTDYQLNNSPTGITLLVDGSKLEDLGAVFSTKTTSVKSVPGLFLKIEVEATENGLLFNGRSVMGSEQPFNDQSTLNLQNFVPTSASSIQWYGLNTEAKTDIKGLDFEKYLSLHDGELCRVKMDLNNRGEDLALLISLYEPEQAEILLNDLATSLMEQNDTLFRESFMDTDITFVNKAELPMSLYGAQFSGFEQTYYTIFNNVLVFGNSVEVLKTLLSEYDAENTWGRSINRRKYLDNLVQESNLTAVYNFEYLLEGLNEKMKESWQTFFNDRVNLTSALDVFSFQLSETGSGVLVNASLDFNESVKANTASIAQSDGGNTPPLETQMNVFADTTLVTAPFVVTNHTNGSQEIVFQDVTNQLYLVNDQGVVQWKKELNLPINGRVTQVDYYNNRKLQYFFVTDSAMHIIDRNGDDVEGFPKPMVTELPLNGHRVVDYDNTKRYRYVGDDRRGNVYLFDKEGDLLEGWNPKTLGSRLLTMPEHVRIRGKDCFVMVETNGRVHLTNRKGEYYPGFPYTTNKRLAGDVYIEKGSDFKQSGIIVASDNGEIIDLNFEAGIRSRNQLLRPGVDSHFKLLKDKLNTGYAVLRRDAKEAVLINEAGKVLFTQPLTAGEQVDFDFYNFRNDSEVFVIRNTAKQAVWIYNKSGKLITAKPLGASASIGIIYYQNRSEYELFVNFANQMAVYKVRK